MMMETIMANMKFQLDKALPALMRSNKDQGASGSGSSPKKGASDDGKRGRSKKGKESTQRNVAVIHQPYLLLLQKIILLKRKKKKASKKRKRHRRKNSSSSSNESDTETYFDTEPFKVISEADKYKYNLPAKIANYTNEQFHSYVKDTDIKQQILLANPVPENLNKTLVTYTKCSFIAVGRSANRAK